MQIEKIGKLKQSNNNKKHRNHTQAQSTTQKMI